MRKEKSGLGFLSSLVQMLDTQTNKNIISWNVDGNGFVILDSKTFEEQMLSKYFSHSNWNSFVRQLNMYNFKRVKGTTEEVEYFNRLFRRNFKNSQALVRKKSEKTKFQVSPCRKTVSSFLNQQVSTSETGEAHSTFRKQPSSIFLMARLITDNNRLLNEQCSLFRQLCQSLQCLKKPWEDLSHQKSIIHMPVAQVDQEGSLRRIGNLEQTMESSGQGYLSSNRDLLARMEEEANKIMMNETSKYLTLSVPYD